MSIPASRPAMAGHTDGPVLRFIFVPDGAEVPADALAEFADPIRLRATYVPGEPGGRTRAERGRGWSEAAAGQSEEAGSVPALNGGAAGTKDAIFGSDGRQRRPAAYGWPATAAAVSPSRGAVPALATTMRDQPPAPAEAKPQAKSVSAENSDPDAPVPFVDDLGSPIMIQLNEPNSKPIDKPNNEPMMRPVGLDPHFLVHKRA